MTVEPVSADARRVGIRQYDKYETICASCDGIALAYGGGSLWCLKCITPLIEVGKSFVPSIEVKRREA